MNRDCRIEYYKDKNEKFRCRIFGANGKQLSRSTKGYKNKARLRYLVHTCGDSPDQVNVYRGKAGEYRWNASYQGDKVIMASEGYKNRSECVHSLNLSIDERELDNPPGT
jgi:uncharacterized protein YegP (UPF0339 family)